MSGEGNYLRIAYILGAHGLYGRLKISVVSDNFGRFDANKAVYLKIGDVYKEHIIESFQIVKRRTALLKLSGISDRTDAEALRKAELFITKDEAECTRELMDENTFYYYDIIGCDVYKDGERVGAVSDIMQGGGDVLIISVAEGKSFMIPFVESMVDVSRVSEKRIDITPVEGLLDI